MERLIKGNIYTAKVEGCGSDGRGIVRIDAQVVFVPMAVRGETVRVRIVHVGQRTAAGEIVEILERSPARVEPDCPYYGRCGGCCYRHMRYEEELEMKRRRIDDAFERIGGLSLRVSGMLGAEDILRYRNKGQYPVGKNGIGFFKGGSHEVIPVTDCRIEPAEMSATVAAVWEWMRRYKITSYDEKTGRGLVRHVFVRVNHLGESLCCLVANAERLPHEPELAAILRRAVPKTLGVLVNTNTRRTNVILGEKTRAVWGAETIEDVLCGETFRLSVPSFFQVNRRQAERLYMKALDYAALTGTETVVDLYCGAGTITMCLARRAKKVIGVEIVPEAIRDAKENAARNGVKNAAFFCEDATSAAERFLREGIRPDVITVDPPRKGLTKEGIAAAVQMAPKRIVYVSCDPATLARDLKIFEEAGYRAEEATGVDLFPGTAHVECVVLMSRADR